MLAMLASIEYAERFEYIYLYDNIFKIPDLFQLKALFYFVLIFHRLLSSFFFFSFEKEFLCISLAILELTL